MRIDHNEETCAIETLNVPSITRDFSDIGVMTTRKPKSPSCPTLKVKIDKLLVLPLEFALSI